MGHMTTRSMATGTTVQDNAELDRYELFVEHDDELAGYLSYQKTDDHVLISSTVVRPEHRGRRLASELVHHAMDDVRRQGLSVRTTCWYVKEWLDSHPDYHDLEFRRPSES